MSEELIPCPFCGESSRVEINTYTEQIVCGQCGAVVYYKYWQTRPIEDELRKRIAELERDFDMLFRAVIAASKQSRKNTQTQTFVYGKESEE